jgi:hypothetical protein
LNAAQAYCVAAVLGVAALLLSAYRATPSAEARRRIRLVVFGTVLACAPTAVLSILPEILGRGRPVLVPYAFTLPFLLLIPICYTLAIQRHNLLRVERLANRGVVHVVVFGVLAFVYVALAVGLPWLWPWADGPLTRGLIVLVVAILFGPTRGRLQRVADRVVYGGWYDYRSVLGEVTQGLAGLVDADTLADLLGRRLPQILHLEGAALLLHGGEHGLELVSSSGRPIEAELRDLPPEQRTLPRNGALGRALLRASRPMTTAELAEAVVSPSVAEQMWLRRSGVELWVRSCGATRCRGCCCSGRSRGASPSAPGTGVCSRRWPGAPPSRSRTWGCFRRCGGAPTR